MSLTINQKPDSYALGYNDLNFVISESSSSIYGKDNFKFIGEVVVDSTTVAKLKTPIYYNSTNKGVFNIGRIMENYVSHDFNYSDTLASGCPNSYKDYQVKFGYEYSITPSGTITEYLNVGNTSGTIWNGVLNAMDFVTYDETDYLGAKFLTTIRSQYIHRTQKAWLYALKGTATNLRINYSNGTNTSLSLPSSKVVRIPINLSTPSGATYFDCFLRDVDGIQVSETYRFYIKDECSKYDVYDVFFLNRLGGFDSFRFNKVSKTSFDIMRKTYRQNPYVLNNTAVTWSYAQNAHSNVQYYEESKQKMTLFSDWITDTESIWLRELVESPVVYLWDGSILQAINITNANYEQKKHINDKMFNLQLDIELSFVDKKQRR